MDQNFETIAEWKAAGSPAGNETNNVTIGGGSGSSSNEPPQSSSISPSAQESGGYALATQEDSSEQIQKEYRDALAYNQRIQSGQEAVGEDFDWAAQNTSIENIKAKQVAISQINEIEQSYKDASIEIPSDVKAQLEQTRAAALSPFVSMGKEAFVSNAVANGMSRAEATAQYETNKGVYSVDVPTAVRAGIGDKAIERLMGEGAGEAIRGAKDYWSQVEAQRTDIASQNKAIASLELYKSGTGYDIDKAIKEGHLTDVQKAGFAKEDITAAQSRLGVAAQSPYLNNKSTIALPTAEEMAKYGISSVEQAKIKDMQKGFAAIPSGMSLTPSGLISNIKPPPPMSLDQYIANTLYSNNITQSKIDFGQNPELILSKDKNVQADYAIWSNQQNAIAKATKDYRTQYGEGKFGQTITATTIGQNIGIFPLPAIDIALQPGGNLKKPSFADWAWTGATALSIFTPKLGLFKGKTPPSTAWAAGTDIESIISKGRATGIPVEGLGQIRTLEGNLVRIPLNITKESPTGISSLKQPALWLRNAPSYLVRGEVNESPFIIKGFAGKASLGEKLIINYEEGAGGIYRPKYYIGGKELNIPIQPEWNPGDLTATRQTGFYYPKGGLKSSGGSSSAVADSYRMTGAQAARLASENGINISKPSYVWYEQIGGVLVPRISSFPQPNKIPTTKVILEEITTPISVPIIAPSITPIANPIEVPSIIQAPLAQPNIVTTPIEISIPTPTPTAMPIPIEIAVPDIPKLYIPTPDILTPIVTEPPVRKFPPIKPSIPAGTTGVGTGRASDRLKKYFLRTYTMPELYVALPTGLLMKPEKLGKRLWKKMIQQPEGADLTASEDMFDGVPGESDTSVETPFGIKRDVKIISRKVKVRAGASELNRTYRGRELSGTTLGINL